MKRIAPVAEFRAVSVAPNARHAPSWKGVGSNGRLGGACCAKTGHRVAATAITMPMQAATVALHNDCVDIMSDNVGGSRNKRTDVRSRFREQPIEDPRQAGDQHRRVRLGKMVVGDTNRDAPA
jgi:hypothetical protein